MSAIASDWWNRPGGMREVLTVAIPLVVSTIAWTLMNVIDRVFLMWYSADAVAAALPAGMLSFLAVCFPLGVACYANTFVAQYYGAERYDRIGSAVWQGVLLGVVSTPLVLLTIPWMPWLLAFAEHPPQIAELELICYDMLAYGAGAIVISGALEAFFSGRGQVRVVMVVNCAAALINVVLDYGLIFGHFGLPAWGIRGAALATVIAMWCKVVVLLWLMLRPELRRVYGTWSGCRFDREMMLRLLRFGTPNGVQFFVDVCAFTGFLLLVGRLGSLEMTATSLAFNVNNFAFMPVLGVGWATSTLVGQWLGRNQPDVAQRAAWSAFWLTGTYMLLIGAVYVLLPDLLLWPYRGQADAAQFDEVRLVTIVLLRFVASYSLFDAMAVTFSAVIKGAGDTRFVLITQVALAPVPVVLTYVGMKYYGLGLYWAWLSATIWVVLMGLAYGARFLQGHWRSMRVIEQTPEMPDLPPLPKPAVAID